MNWTMPAGGPPRGRGDNRRLRRSLIGLAALLIVAITAGVLFVRQR